MNILSLDGGGEKGLTTLAILKRLVAQYPNLVENTTLCAGTSTGSIIALGLAAGISIDQLIDLYQKDGSQIFSTSLLGDIEDLGGLSHAKYSNVNLTKLLQGLFGNLKLSDLKKKVLCPSFNLDNKAEVNRTWAPKFWHNFDGPDSDGDELVVDVALYSSAAPTFFPAHKTYVDGGVVCNNPSLAALCQALNSGVKLNDINLLSLGTGDNLTYVEGENLNYGLAEWAPLLIDLLMEASSGLADYQSNELLKEKYRRVNVVFPKGVNIKMDNYKAASQLYDLGANADLGDTIPWLEKIKW